MFVGKFNISDKRYIFPKNKECSCIQTTEVS